MFGFGNKKSVYDEGYSDGQQYAGEYPGLRERALSSVQCQLNALNEELGMDDDDQMKYESGFYDGYMGEAYDAPEPPRSLLRRLIGI